MTIHIYYRHTPTSRSSNKWRPEWFTHERCFLNLLETTHKSMMRGDVSLHVLFDGSEADLADDFTTPVLARAIEQFPGMAGAVSVQRISGGDQRKAWRACVDVITADLATTIQPHDIIYVLENDYLHVDGWPDEIRELATSGISWDYLSLYDHPDKYPNLCAHGDAKRYATLKSQVFSTSRRHWRTAPSTCGTYMLSRETFERDIRLLRLGIFDFKFFKILTKIKRRKLVTPMPALSTHCMTEFLSPVIDWESVAVDRRFIR
ncbi:glycosyl transferase [Pandoraea apista]|uniref:glycosyl transferase n=1 Tax=Pandoraea apista TaxID=93218 RepID=UPI000F68ED12|nr:glycosyl transferase [Pandoraea apista]